MMEMRRDTDKIFCSILFDILIEKGVKDVVCSPGSRNTPLLLAAAARETMRKHVVVDERAAAFMALGMAIVSRRPVAIVCTSGTALLNYAPAVAEAFYQSIPLIVISADRPEQWIDQDDSQTLRQFEALSNFVKKSYELPAWGNDEKELQWYANRVVNDAMIEATGRRPGPVHINVRLGEPLGETVSRLPRKERTIELLNADGFVNKEMIRNLAGRISGSRVFLVAGFLPPDAPLHRAVAEFCRMPNVVAMTETLSNLHLSDHAGSIDSVLTAYPEEVLKAHAPDLIISLGGSLVSRKLKEYLRSISSGCEHWALGWNHTTSDCFMSLTKRLECSPARLLRQFSIILKKNQPEGCAESFSSQWLKLRENALTIKNRYIADAPWSELKAFSIIGESLPGSVNLFLSNGTPVRYAQIIDSAQPHASYCNRGVSGIDGCASTAVGGGKQYNGVTVLVTGDMSMAYDVSALSLPDIPGRMKIIVIDNGGGGIFRFIPTTRGLEEREKYFCVCPRLPLRQLAEGYGWMYGEAGNEEELRHGMRNLIASPEKGILRVVCDGEISASALIGYMEARSYNEDR